MDSTHETEHKTRSKVGTILTIALIMIGIGAISIRKNVNNRLNLAFKMSSANSNKLMHGYFRETENPEVCWLLEQRGDLFHLIGQSSLSKPVCSQVVGHVDWSRGRAGSGTMNVTSPAGELSTWTFKITNKKMDITWDGDTLGSSEMEQVDWCQLEEKPIRLSVDARAMVDTHVFADDHMDRMITGHWFALDDAAHPHRTVKKEGLNTYEMESNGVFVTVFVKKMVYRFTSPTKNADGLYEGVVTYILRGGVEVDLKFTLEDDLKGGKLRLWNLDGSGVRFVYSRVR